MADKLKVLAHPTRLEIMSMLFGRGKMNVTQLYGALNLPQSTTSQHTARLKSAGLLVGKRDGLEVYYDVHEENVRELRSVLHVSR
ncbi:ArsR/SmtB family transcription factor [Ectobacillus ponti]|uniref:ArsR/SmtB family transcription factor n=1 Tax=Ectobacillus ponti TaxID=2961894 RepID=UPI0034D2C56A